jgi:hypothetical protein
MAMAQPLSPPNPLLAVSRPRDGLRAALLWGSAGLGAALVVAAGALWFHYGTAVFFEMIASGISSCF